MGRWTESENCKAVSEYSIKVKGKSIKNNYNYFNLVTSSQHKKGYSVDKISKERRERARPVWMVLGKLDSRGQSNETRHSVTPRRKMNSKWVEDRK